jgi:hypothetical protein
MLSDILFKMNAESTVIVDIQCFKDNDNKFIIKEIAAIYVQSGSILCHHIISPPYPRNLLSAERIQQTYWLIKYNHGLEWTIGDISYHLLLDKLKKIFNLISIVLVKGREKCDYLQTILPQQCNVAVLDNFYCKRQEVIMELFIKDTVRCNNLMGTHHKCAVSNIVNLRKWYILTQNSDRL